MVNLEIANTIKETLYGLNKMAVWGWGSNKFRVIEKGLKFQINTPKIKYGWVEIVLNEGKDLYELKFFNSRMRLLSEVKDVYFDMLINIIDSNIEKEEYLKQIRR